MPDLVLQGYQQLKSSLSLKIDLRSDDNNAALLEQVYSEIVLLGEKEGWPPKLVYMVNLVLEELEVNALTHGRASGLEEYRITIDSQPDAVVIELSDDGPPFNPLTDAPSPDLDSPLESRPIGGLGIYLIKTMVDDISYQRETDRNYLTLKIGRDK